MKWTPIEVLIFRFPHNNLKELTDLRVKEDEMGRACSTNGGDNEYIKDIGGKARRKEFLLAFPIERPRRRWVDNIKMYLRETGWDVMDWIDLAQDRDQWRALVNTVMNHRVP
jgi:hypothetical protein